MRYHAGIKRLFLNKGSNSGHIVPLGSLNLENVAGMTPASEINDLRPWMKCSIPEKLGYATVISTLTL